MQQPSIQVRNLIETAVLHLQHSPELNEEEVRWIQQFAAHLITEFSVLKDGDVEKGKALESTVQGCAITSDIPKPTTGFPTVS